MLLQSVTATTATAAPVHHHRVRPLSFSVHISRLLSSPPGFSTSILLYSPKGPAVSCSSKSNASTVDYGKKPKLDWYKMYKRICIAALSGPTSVDAVLEQFENGGADLSISNLVLIIKELRTFKRYKLALQVYEWMKDRKDTYHASKKGAAVHLNLIYRVKGISNAEDYFMKLPEHVKDNRVYASLLNAYAQSEMREKAESLFDEMKTRGFASTSVPYNVMITLYNKLKVNDQVERLISEMDSKNILDMVSYNIWLGFLGNQGSVEKMEEAFEKMKKDPGVIIHWDTLSIMASMYIQMGEMEKGEDFLRQMESRINVKEPICYDYLMSLYARVGNKEEVYRVWNVYNASFRRIPNKGYHALISSLLRLDDIEGAENTFDEWMSEIKRYDPRMPYLLLSWYLRNGLLDKVESLFARIVDAGKQPNSSAWEIIAQLHIRRGRVSEALSCLRDALSAEGSGNWTPSHPTIFSFMQLCEQHDDVKSKEELIEMLSDAGRFDREAYMSYISVQSTVDGGKKDGDEITDVLLNELHGSLQ
ncbi:unnamed protein product [Cuscuta epithymum]|uniref:Pentatricopeptide repeat-containing protein n=1 Tax=Cuscuta epithymum TaxID=186058 RepID=A0AAV0DCT2_9ASTE|nr:unnamed protein product [Cuscuta epithymum]